MSASSTSSTGDGLLYEELLPIRPCHPAPSPVVQMGAPDLQIHRDGRLNLVADRIGNLHVSHLVFRRYIWNVVTSGTLAPGR